MLEMRQHSLKTRWEPLGLSRFSGLFQQSLEPVLKSAFLWSTDAPQHHADHRNVNHSLRIFDFGFVVAYQAAVLHKPAEGALDDPTPGQHFEAALDRRAHLRDRKSTRLKS